MKPKFENVQLNEVETSFAVQNVTLDEFEFNWHYHPEYEITFIRRGSGTRYVGDSIENFYDFDLTMIGPNLPHTWVSMKSEKPPLSSTVIQFKEDFISTWIKYPEFAELQLLLENCKRGLYFTLSNNNEFSYLIEDLLNQTGIRKIIVFLKLLYVLSQQNSVVLSSNDYVFIKSEINNKRINKIYNYVQQNFSKSVSATEGASLINLSESAFCHFFKKSTGKTFSDYINEVRISHACNLLLLTDTTISEVAFSCGFDSLTYFNRVFKSKKHATPRDFKKRKKDYN